MVTASVTTYINSGNVVFSSRMRIRTKLAARLEEAIAARFGFAVKVLVRDLDGIRAAVGAIAPGWVNDADKVTRSGMMKLVGSPLYKQMTIRNCNTARKLLELMNLQSQPRRAR